MRGSFDSPTPGHGRRKPLLARPLTALPLAAVPLAAALMLGLAACGSSDDDSSTTTTTTSDTSTTTTTAVSDTTPSSPSSTSSPPTSVPSSTENKYLTNVQVTGSGNTDTVIFTFDNGAPGFLSEIVPTSSVTDGEDKPVTLNSGGQTMRVTFKLAASVKLTGGIQPTYSGPRRFTPTGTTIAQEVLRLGESEGTMSWAIGLSIPTTVEAVSSGNTITFTLTR